MRDVLGSCCLHTSCEWFKFFYESLAGKIYKDHKYESWRFLSMARQGLLEIKDDPFAFVFEWKRKGDYGS
jgi:hypothetical protein